jgi:acetyl-CoA carboxylase alpha subunit
MAQAGGYRKAIRLMRLAAASDSGRDLVDTPGAFPGVQAEERGRQKPLPDRPRNACR